MRKLIFCLFLLLPLYGFGQNVTVKGRITDSSDGNPIIGAAAIQKGGKTGTTSDIDGNYTITVPKGAVVVFSYLGMLEKEKKVEQDCVLDIALEPDVTQLEDVLVVAYGTSTKETFTGSAEAISANKIKDRSVTSVTSALDGQVSGVMSTSGSGQPGSGADIVIRGFGSINASNSPLIVVDGVPFDGDLASLNAADIDNVSVLKDASAGALYGSRGANGVVIVTTKKGNAKNETLNIDLSIKAGVNSRSIPFYETINQKDYMELMYNACYNDLVYTEGYLPSVAKTMTAGRLSKQILGAENMYNPYDKSVNELFTEDGKIVSDAKLKYDENWLKEATAKCPVRQEYQLSMSGGTSKAKYVASGSYLNEQGTLKTTSFERFTIRAGADFSPYKWLDFGANVNYSYSKSNFMSAGGREANNVWYSAMMMAPIYPLYEKDAKGKDVLDDDGNKIFDYGQSRPAGAQNSRNCIATLYDDKNYCLTDNVNTRAYLAFNIKDFKLSTNIGADLINTNRSVKYNRKSGNAAGTGRLEKDYLRTLSYTWNQLLSYKHKFGEHLVDAMIGHEFYNCTDKYMTGSKTGFPIDDFDELGLGSTTGELYSEGGTYSINSFLMRANWSYADKYYASVSARGDGSSRFKKENRWGAFWSLGASWRLSQENWLKNVSWINNITLKASYGVQGNDEIGYYYAWQSLYYLGFPNANASGGVVASIENKDITWEKNGNLNIGLEFRLFNRLSGTIEWYNRRTSDLLLEYPMAISLGFSGYNANIGSMNNNGWDITLNYDIFNKKDLYWGVSLIASTVTNKVLSLTGNGEDIISGYFLIREGLPINTFYMAKSAGVDPATGEQLFWAYKKDTDGKMIPGSEYVTNESTVASSCKYTFGSRIPYLYGSVGTNLNIHGFDLNLLFTYSLGGKIYDSTYASMMAPSFVGQTYHKNALRSWKNAGDVTDVPRITTTNAEITNDRYLVDASYFTIKSATLGYNFKFPWMDSCRIKTLRLFLSGDNLFLLSSMKGLNPQESFKGTTSFSYTPNRTVSLGIDLKF